MKKQKMIVAIVLFLTPMFLNAQTTDSLQTMEYTRGKGFVIRPELCSGVLANIGYQINPYLQITGCLGFGLGGSNPVITLIGIRAYTSHKPWSAFFDYHVGTESVSTISIARHTLIAGASYKDFDFGAGVGYASYGTESATGWALSLGYNIRCYKHR